MGCPPVPPLPPSALEGIETLLDDAGHLIRIYRQRLRDTDQPLAVATKHTLLPDGSRYASPVTPLDTAVQRVLVGGLTRLLGPDLAIFAEEEGLDDTAALEQPWHAVIDPIDITRGLLAGRAIFTVNVAVVLDGAVYGWMDAPAVGWRLRTSPEQITSNGHDLPPVAARPDQLRIAVSFEDYQTHQGDLPARLGERVVVPTVVSGIAWRLALLTLGLVDAVVLWPNPNRAAFGLWDHLPISANLPVLGLGIRGLSQDADLARLRPPRWPHGLVAAPADILEPLRAALLAGPASQ